MASKQSNLFSFFSKTPNKTQNNNTPSKDVLSPRRSPNSVKGKSPVANGKQEPQESKKEDTEFKPGDVVWSKLEGYPWWPGLVCNHPTHKKHYQGGKTPKIHVQFFDNPTSRAWIKVKYVKPFKGSDDTAFQRGGQFHSNDSECFDGALQADKALKLSQDERLSSLIVELQPSESEESEDELAAPMDFDPDIFDDDMEEDEEVNNSKENHNSSKENHNSSKENDEMNTSKKSENKTPKKSPKKRHRPSRNHKRRKIIISMSGDEESGDEFKPESGSSDDDSVSSGVDENEVSGPDTESETDSPVKAGKRKRPSSTPKPKSTNQPSIIDRLQGSMLSAERRHTFKPAVSDKTKSRLSSFSAPEAPAGETSEVATEYPHTKLEFLQPENIKDKNGKRKCDDDYDPRTLYVPESFLKKQTPGMKQWWELKADHYDTVLFFKMGKFYELFHMDSAIAVSELGLIYMKGDHAHSGFPEIAYTRYADSLIQKGYKVARIEQTETPDMMSERCKSMSRTATKFDKVVKREVCQVTSRGTKTYRHVEGDCTDMDSNYLLAIAEKETGTEGQSDFGVCFIDTSIGIFHVGQFTDDRHCSRLRTLIAHYTPCLVLHERGKMSAKTSQLINTNLMSVRKEALSSGPEFWDSSKTLKTLVEEEYFKEENEEFEWPGDLKNMISKSDSLGLTAADEFDLAVRSLGAVTWYLQYSLLDQELLSMKKFILYQPVDSAPVQKKKSDFSQRHMVLDGVTLKNLDLVENSVTGTVEGTLLERLDQCSTPFGKRLFRQWLCAPLCNPAAIEDRLDAVEDLMAAQDLLTEALDVLKKLPDLERLLSRIHTLGSAARSKNHPDSRAILYEEVTYSKRKIEDFLATLGGFKAAFSLAQKMKPHAQSFKSKLLKKTVLIDSNSPDIGHFPDINDELKFFDAAFDHAKAKKDGTIIPNKGVNAEYDEATKDMKSTEKKLTQYLDKQRDRLRCMAMVYWGTGKNRYQMEVPESAWKRVPDNYEVMSSKKGWKRYRTSEIEDMLADMTEAEERKDSALKDTMRCVFHSFDERHKKWRAVVDCLSVLDVLICLAQYSRCGDGITCRPTVVPLEESTEPFLELREARHPCVSRTFSGGDFIPNDTIIGTKDEGDDEDGSYSTSQIVLVTGPNMGGKSTLMRQVGLITVMAQLGCYVPAEKCRLTPVDRVFTRLGASDRIMAGESTFFVELSETSSILQHATKHSLVLVDELGRGTATYDGTAIACSVVQELSQSVNCRTLFSTHYHSLVEEFSHDANIRLGHMACMVENENEEDPSQETITFLYKFVKGACPKSYGFNAARLANIPEDVIKNAVRKSKAFEDSFNRLKVLRSLWPECQADTVRKLQEVL